MSSVHARPELPKRFYDTVSVEPVEGGFSIHLDGRSVKTPDGSCSSCRTAARQIGCARNGTRRPSGSIRRQCR